MVKKRPATARGIAVAVATEISSFAPPLCTKIIADATDARATSGATAAPIFAQPRAIS